MNHKHPPDQVQTLRSRNEFYAAVFCLIDKTLFRDQSEVLHDLKTEVGAILKEAMAKDFWPEASKIVKHFARYLHENDYDEAQLEINGVTIPDDVVELDERALLL